ncbi:MAG: hypothetical protein RL213_2086 [Bacteroidota bacterium]
MYSIEAVATKGLSYFCRVSKLKYLLFLFCLVSWWCPVTVFSQGRPGPGGRPGGPPDQPKIGIISGTVFDDSTGAPLPFVSVGAFRLPDTSASGGTMSDERGRFKIQELSPGNYLLKVNSVGYRTKSIPVGRVTPDKYHLSGIEVRMRTSVTRLKEVKVEAETPEFMNSIDKKVYSVDKNIVNTGGTVTDVLQQIPSIQVDIDGKVALRGSENVTILIDGKPSGMLGNDRRAVLQQIPAAAVDQIEVVTNPSAKYDAEGMAGIINIKTKKDKFQGTNGNISAGVGTNDKYNAGVSMNDRTAHRNFFLNYNYRHEDRNNNGEGEQYNYFGGADDYSWLSDNFGTHSSGMQNAKAGVDLYFGPRNTLGVSGGFSVRKEKKPEQVSYLFYDSAGALYGQGSLHPSFIKNNTTDEDNRNIDGNIDFKHLWAANKGELTASSSYSTNRKNSDGYFSNTLYDLDGIPYQKSLNRGAFQSSVSQADLSRIFKSVGKLEAGIKNSIRNVENEQSLGYYQQAGADYLNDSSYSDLFIFNEQVIAGYAMFSGKSGKFEYNGGLRAEQTLIDIDSRQAGAFENDYLNLFPSAFLKYSFSETNELQLGYSRRINRADSRQLNPFTDYSDSLSIRRGNPYLLPELVHSMDLSYARNWKGTSLNASVYFRHTDDLITRFRSVDTLTGISTMTSVNYSSSENVGVEATLRAAFSKAVNLMAGFNLFRNSIDASNISPDLQSESTQWSTRLNLTAKATLSTTFQLTANYMSPMKSPIGEFRGMSGLDAGVRQELWKGKGSISLNVTDIFRTRIMRVHNFVEGVYDYNGERYRESRVGMLTLQYRFGTNENLRKRSRQEQRPSMEIMDNTMDF